MSKYKRFIVIYSLILLIVSVCALVYVWNSVKLYELSDKDNYMNYVLKNLKNDIINKNAFKYVVSDNIENEFEDVTFSNGLAKLINDKKITYKLSDEDENKYFIYISDILIGNIQIEKKDTIKRLGILTIDLWDTDDIVLDGSNGIYKYDFNINDGEELYINDILVSDEYIVSYDYVEGYEFVEGNEYLPKIIKYSVDKFNDIPKIEIKKNDKNVLVMHNDNLYYSNEFKKFKTYEELLAYMPLNINILEFAENWSLYLTNDLSGNYHGFNIIEKYLCKNTSFYNQALSWGKGVDITFTSVHSFGNPKFSNEVVQNFVVYNDYSFSVEVYLEKNLIVGGIHKVDVLHEKIFYVYDGDTYKVVSIKNIVEE